jgi:hypothetical protein
MLPHHIALLSDTRAVDFAALEPVAAAMQKQVTEDFSPVWGIKAQVVAYRSAADIPHGFWRIIVKDRLTRPEAAGYHEDDLSEPYALVRHTDDWSVTASHEMLELLADPWGRHLATSPSLLDPKKRVRYLVEVSDPCSDAQYTIDGIAVSDFYTPHYFDDVKTDGVHYSRTKKITAPREVLKGGYLTWYDPEEKKWFHRSWFDDGAGPTDGEVPIPALVKGNIRATIDRHFGPLRAAANKR